MNNKRTNYITRIAVGAMLLCLALPSYVYASDGERYITISVDATDNNGDLQYALDTDDPSAFSESNEFTVAAGTSHTIYVKDAAGNITSQRYEPEKKESDPYDYSETDPDEQQINIDLELGRKESVKDYSSNEERRSGTASVTERTKTDGSVDADKVFYTFTTKEGVELYLVVDQARGSDNVYLLDTVSLRDLRDLADSSEASSDAIGDKNEKEDNLLSVLASEDADDELKEADTSKKKKSSSGNPLLILLLAGIGGGAYYYLKIYRTKKDEKMDEMDAMDMDDFETVDDEEEAEFDYDDEEKQRYLEALLNDDESEDVLNADPTNMRRRIQKWKMMM